ncbi:hypothetical protein [Actinacidiphila paucisporea]|uniref:Uncharacterized protein n=1 Tax=Actinacidiphila paucisporea TaxID=310782 RepID=A0A1M7NSK8_9ACTN|nr:hypothetical protein [Actinacidiphila paucisporea]SHN06625.1 hypothetical protein SAMN05216499_119135 [Actinacidiphila paucisporea]
MHKVQRGWAHREGAGAARQLPETRYCSGHDALGEHRPHRLAAGHRLCPVCGERVGTTLRALPRLYAACEDALGPALGGFRQRVSGSRSMGMALNERAMDARSDMVTVLASWSDMVVGERRASAPRGRTVRDLATFVAAHLGWLLAHPAADDFVSEIVTVEKAARQAVDAGPAPRELGRCPEPECTSPVRSSAQPGEVFAVSCGVGHVLSPQQWLRFGRRADS